MEETETYPTTLDELAANHPTPLAVIAHTDSSRLYMATEAAKYSFEQAEKSEIEAAKILEETQIDLQITDRFRTEAVSAFDQAADRQHEAAAQKARLAPANALAETITKQQARLSAPMRWAAIAACAVAATTGSHRYADTQVGTNSYVPIMDTRFYEGLGLAGGSAVGGLLGLLITGPAARTHAHIRLKLKRS